MRQSGQMNYGKTNTLKKLLVLQFFFQTNILTSQVPKTKQNPKWNFYQIILYIYSKRNGMFIMFIQASVYFQLFFHLIHSG